MNIFQRWGITEDILKRCYGSRDVICEAGTWCEKVPSERTARRIMATWREQESREEKSLPYFDSPDIFHEEVPDVLAGTVSSIRSEAKCLEPGVYVFTSAQPETKVHDAFFSTLLLYCERRGASLIVGGCTHGREPKHGWAWDSRVEPHLCLAPLYIGSDLMFCGELSINPMLNDPLTTLDDYTGTCSGIFPHPQIRLKSLPYSDSAPRFHYTTGSVTLRNYFPSKNGHKAAHKHTYGALVVEVDKDGVWFARQIQADFSGAFYDLDVLYDYDSTLHQQRVEAITWGDIHFPNEDRPFWTYSAYMNSILKPKYQFVHDVYDFHVRNHHTIKDKHDMYKKFIDGADSVNHELYDVVLKLNDLADSSPDDSIVHVVPSNHEEALVKWLKNADVSHDYLNVEFYLTAQTHLYNYIKKDVKYPFLRYLMESIGYVLDERIFFGKGSCKIQPCMETIECGIHGHLGVNGARASTTSYTRTGERVNLGHSHSASIIGNVYQSGTSTPLRISYNKDGLSTWSNSCIVTYKNDSRTIITTRGARWRL